MAEEPATKRRRVHHGSPLAARFVEPPTSPPAQFPSEGIGFENIDPFLSPATASTWPFDEFAHDPDYLASQEALRSLLFTTARSGAPTREGSPSEAEESTGSFNIKHVLAKGRRVEYLKNYMSKVAPWVSVIPKLRNVTIDMQ